MRRLLLPLPLVTLPLLAALALPGCLEAGRGHTAADTIAADTFATDTATTDTLEADTSGEPCAGVDCDDGDPCTWDACNAETGLCEHMALPHTGVARPSECSGDWDCDDGDACTDDVCVRYDDGCGFAWSGCEHEPVPGCAGCQELGCPTNDACLVGVCQNDGSCAYVPAEGCEVATCSSEGARTVTDARYSFYPGDFAKVAGQVGFASVEGCSGRRGDCISPPELRDGTGNVLRLVGPDADADVTWECRTNRWTDESPRCTPVHYRAAYWVWGTATAQDYAAAPRRDPAEVPVPPLPATDTLVVSDYCLQTNAQGLPGRYTAVFSSAAFTTAATLEGEIAVDDTGALALTLSEPFCPNCGASQYSYLFPQTVPLTVGDGWISFSINAPTTCAAMLPPPVATLVSARNTLSGDYHDVWDTSPGVPRDPIAYCSSGAITLTRLP